MALLLGALLDARGLHKTATIQPPGTRRDVAVAVTGGLVRVAATTRLDLLRRSVKSALGRTGDDRVATAVELPAPPAEAVPGSPGRSPTPAPATTQPEKPAAAPAVTYTRAHPLRVWVAGDSLATQPGYALERLTRNMPVDVVAVEARVATGLERPDAYDWFARIRAVSTTLRGGVAVLVFGGNDDNAYMTGLPAGVQVSSFWSEAWRREYGRRVGGVLDVLGARGVHVVWIGLPLTRDASRSDRYAQLNAVVRREVKRRSAWVTYVDTYWLLADHGRFTEVGRAADGTVVQLREPDGIHLRPAAADIVARKVLEDLRGHFRLASGR